MAAKIIDGKHVSQVLREEMKQRTQNLLQKNIHPGLAVILVGEDPASQVYVRNKAKACEDIGLHSRVIRLAGDTSEADLLEQIESLNQDPSIHGILVQIPLPAHIDSGKVLETISPRKDVDGFHRESVGALVTGHAMFYPCTPHGVIKLLEFYQLPLEGLHAVVIGRSNIVGKPVALMLLERGATVTICTSRTKDLKSFTRQADVVVVAVGKPHLLTKDMVKSGAVVVDVGINRLDSGKLVGDVDYENVSEVAGSITPVPGGVGPMTITMLLENTLKAAEAL